MPSLMRYINRTSRLGVLYRNEKLKAYGLKGIHHSYILNICQNPGISQEKLAQLIFVNKSTVTRQLASLEEKGYIYRSPSAHDGRELLVYPTDRAHEVYPFVGEVLREWNEALLEDFTPEEQEVLIGMMGRIMDKAKQEVTSLSDSKPARESRLPEGGPKA